MNVNISVDPPQPGGTWAPSESSPMRWWSRWRTDDSAVIMPGILPCHVLKEMESTAPNNRRNWRTAVSLPDSGYMSGIPCTKGVQSPTRFFMTVHVSDPYITTGRTAALYNLTSVSTILVYSDFLTHNCTFNSTSSIHRWVMRPVGDRVLQHPSSAFDTSQWLQVQQCQNTCNHSQQADQLLGFLCTPLSFCLFIIIRTANFHTLIITQLDRYQWPNRYPNSKVSNRMN